MKRTLLSILTAVLLSSCQTTGMQREMQGYCPPEPEWPSDLSKPMPITKHEMPSGFRLGGPRVLRACLAAQIAEAGRVTAMQVLRADSPEHGSACAAALMRWQFEPARRGSTPVAVTYHMFVRSVTG